MSDSENNLPKLVYYKIRGLCQPVRHILYFIGVEFQDRKLQRDILDSSEQLQSTFNSGLPKFQDQELTMSDCVAIAIYICQKYNHQELVGYTPQTKAKINEVMFKYWMEKNKMVPWIIQIVFKSASETEEEKKKILIKQMLTTMVHQSKFLFFCLKSYKKYKKFILETLTIVDFFFYDICFYITNFFQEYISDDLFLAEIITFSLEFQKLEFFHTKQKQINSVELFFPFSNENKETKVKNAWKKTKQQVVIEN